MDKLIIKDFEYENPGVKFPDYVELNEIQCQRLRKQLQYRIGKDFADCDNLQFILYIQENSKIINDFDANAENFNLMDVFRNLEHDTPTEVYINWHQMDNIDQIKLEDFVKYFDDIWYYGQDDIEIFDDSLDWIISVSHHGKISILEL